MQLFDLLGALRGVAGRGKGTGLPAPLDDSVRAGKGGPLRQAHPCASPGHPGDPPKHEEGPAAVFLRCGLLNSSDSDSLIAIRVSQCRESPCRRIAANWHTRSRTPWVYSLLM